MPPSPPPDTCQVYLIRHGATSANLAKPAILQGRGVNLNLSPQGVWQATQTAQFLAAANLAAVYSSPLLRARETAELIAAPHRLLPVGLIDELVEVDVGTWEGRSWGEIAQSEPAAYKQFQDDPGQFGYAGGETMEMVRQRAEPVLEALFAQHLGQTIAVIAHNVVNRAYLSSLLGLPLAKSRRLCQDNCCINVLEHRAGETILKTMNLLNHLQEAM